MMFFKLSKSSKVDRILIVSLSNVGDVVLTFPVIDFLHATYPLARISVVLGPKASSLLRNIRWIDVVVYDKATSWGMRWQWLRHLRRSRFDLVVDLRNSMLPFLLNAGVITWPSLRKEAVHMRQKHLNRLESVLDHVDHNPVPSCFSKSVSELKSVDVLLKGTRGFVIIVVGAADDRKRWPEENFLKVIRHLRAKGKMVVLLGDKKDAEISARLLHQVRDGVLDLCGKTSLQELLPVIERASWALTNDSGIMHLVSYVGKPVVALFGPTDPHFYGPWSLQSVVIRKEANMASITINDVISQINSFL